MFSFSDQIQSVEINHIGAIQRPKLWTKGNSRCSFLLTSHQAPPQTLIPAAATATAALKTKPIYTSLSTLNVPFLSVI